MAHNIICARNPTTGLTHTLECSGSNELKVVLDAEAQTSLNNIEIAVVNADADLDTINTTLTSKLDSVITNTANIKLSTDSFTTSTRSKASSHQPTTRAITSART